MMSNMKQETQRRDPAAWGVRQCTICGRAGHDANYCRAGQGRGGGGRGFFNQPPRLCHNCGQPGHLQFNCPVDPCQNNVQMPWQRPPNTMNYPSMQQGAYRPPFQQQQVPFQQQAAQVQQQYLPQPLQIMPDPVPRNITFQEPNQTTKDRPMSMYISLN